MDESVNSKNKDVLGFFKYVFQFDDETKNEMLNIVQYVLLSVIPVILVLKGIRHYIPEEDESKGSLEISTEVVGQLIVMVLAIWFINRAVRYIPVYSGVEYGKYDTTSMMVPFLILLFTLQTKLGAKINILFQRVVDAWNGTPQPSGKNDKQTQQSQSKGQGNSQIHVRQPISGAIQQHQPSQADYLDTSQLLPSNPMLSALPSHAVQAPIQPSQNFNEMYHEPMEPMAANGALGGGFTSW
jgi:hypothetical protein